MPSTGFWPGGLNAIDTSANAELETAVLDARQSVESSWTLSTVIVLAITITVGLSRWWRGVDLSLYDAGLCSSSRQLRQPSATQYFAAVAVVGCTLSSLLAAVLIWTQARVSPPSKRMTIHRRQRADPALGGILGGRGVGPNILRRVTGGDQFDLAVRNESETWLRTVDSVVVAGWQYPMETDNRRIWVQRFVVVAIWTAVVLLWRNYQSANDLSATGTAQQFIDSVGSAWWGILAFVGVYLARPIVLFPASVLTIVGGVLFGPFVGVIAVIIGANLSASIAFAIGRSLSAKIDDAATLDTDQQSFIARWSQRMRDNSFETVLLTRLLFLPYDLVNYAAGALRIRYVPFITATALGSLPGTISFVLLGASLDRVDQGLDGLNPYALVASVVIFVASLMVARTLKQRNNTLVANSATLPLEQETP